MCSTVDSSSGGGVGKDGGASTLFSDNWVPAANRMDQDGGSQGFRPYYRDPMRLKNRPVSAAEAPTNGPGPATCVEFLFLLYCRGILNAATGSRALDKPSPTEISAFLDACLQEHVQDRPRGQGNSKSTGRASVATSTPAASTPSGSGKGPAKKRRRESDGDEDETVVRRGKRRGGKERDANAKFACPFYMFDKHKHSRCRSAVFRNFSDLLHHFGRTHEPPANSCDTCGEVFDSPAELSAHEQSPTQCRTQTFAHLWAREQDFGAVRENRQNGPHLKARWFVTYDTIFGTRRRRPEFCIVSAQDFMDMLSEIQQSADFQALIFNNEILRRFWQNFRDIVVRYFAQVEQLSLYPGRPFDGNHRTGLHLGLGPSTQQTILPGTAQDVFEPTTQFQSDGRYSLGTYPTMPIIGSPGAANPLIDLFFPNDMGNDMGLGVDLGHHSGLGSFTAQAFHPQLPQNARGSTHMHLPMQDLTGHATSLGVTPLTALQMFSHNPLNPGSSPATQATAEPLGQVYGMPTVPQTYPQQPAQPSQMNIDPPGSQSSLPGMLTGLNQTQSDQSIDNNGASAPASNFGIHHQ